MTSGVPSNVPPRKPAGAAFYPEDMSKAEFESWVKTLDLEPVSTKRPASLLVIHRDNGTLKAVPYSAEYKADLARLAGLLRDAAAATSNPTLKKFLTSRATAFAL